jgi:hypothetical protein
MKYNLNDEVEFTNKINNLSKYDDWKIVAIINKDHDYSITYTIFSQKAYENKSGHTGKWLGADKILGGHLNKTYGHWQVQPEEITLKNKSIISSYEDLKVGQMLTTKILNDWYEAGLNKYSDASSKWVKEGRNFLSSRTIESIKFHHGKMAMQVSGTTHDVWINIEGLSDFINKDNRIFPNLTLGEERAIITLADVSVTIQDLANSIGNGNIVSFSTYSQLKGGNSFQKATNIFDALGRITKTNIFEGSSTPDAVSTIKGNSLPASFSNAHAIQKHFISCTPTEKEQVEKVNLIKTNPVKVTGYNYVTPKNK